MLALAAAAFGLAACDNEEEDLFSSSAAERLIDAQAEYSDALTAHGGTWVMEYFPTNYVAADEDKGAVYKGYAIVLRFTKDGRVTASMLNEASNGKYMEDESCWEVITDNGPSLTFNTFNKVIHTFSDPDDFPGTSDDETGVGLEGDYEFTIIDMSADGNTAKIKGKKRGTYQFLTRLPEDTDPQAYLQDIEDFKAKVFSPSAPSVCVMNIGNSEFCLGEMSNTIANIYTYGKNPEGKYFAFIVTKHDDSYYIRFRDDLKLTDKTTGDTVSYAKPVLRYDAEAQKFFDTGDNGNAIYGEDPVGFLHKQIGKASTLLFRQANAMSEKVRVVNDAMIEELNADKRSLDGDIKIVCAGDSTMLLSIPVKFNITMPGQKKPVTQHKVYKYLCDIIPAEGGVSMTYRQPYDADAQNALDKYGQISVFIEMMASNYAVIYNETPFNLSTMKLSNTNDSEMWYVVSLQTK